MHLRGYSDTAESTGSSHKDCTRSYDPEVYIRDKAYLRYSSGASGSDPFGLEIITHTFVVLMYMCMGQGHGRSIAVNMDYREYMTRGKRSL